MASFTSQVGDYLTGSAEVVFGLPGDLNYSKNGMIYGARLYDATRSLRISDPEFAANLDEHFRQCVFYDVLLGRYSMKELAETNDIWATIAPGSQARAQRFLTRDASSGQVTLDIVTCREAYDALNAQWAGLIDGMGTVFGRQLYPNQTAALAKAKLFADLPVAYQYLAGVSASATDIFKQTLTINAMSQAMHSMSGSSGAGNVDVYAQTRADIQTERTYGSIASNAMKWVPLLNVVLTVLFYALFPVLFPLFLMPKTGPARAQGLRHRLLLPRRLGSAVRDPAHDADVQGRGRHERGRAAPAASASPASPAWPTSTAISACSPATSSPRCRSSPAASPRARWRSRTTRRATSIPARTRPRKPRARRAPAMSRSATPASRIRRVLTRQFAQGTIAPSFTYGAARPARSATPAR